MSNRHRVPDPPLGLVNETRDLLITLEATVVNLRQFAERLRAATAEDEQENPSA
jgi:hypothetical protein